MSSRSPKKALFAQFAAVARAFGSENRLELLEQLAQGERSVELLAKRTDLSIANASQHLRQIAERNSAEVERLVRSYFHDRDSLEPVTREKLLQLSRAGAVTVLDVRPEDEFALGHVAGALNIPLRELEARLDELDPSQEIIAYCRSHYCVLSYEAVATLRTRGFKARRLEEGLPEWRAAGLPVVTGSG